VERERVENGDRERERELRKRGRVERGTMETKKP